MLTEEQIKNLKPGDPIVILTTFDHIDEDADIWFKAPSNNCDRSYCFISSDCVYLPSDSSRTFCHVVDNMVKPKYDPCRLFKEGDKVRLVKRRGRYYSSTDEKYADLILTVHSDEVTDSHQSEIWVSVETEDDETCWATDPVYLELVTPVEELEPYKVWDTTFSFNVGVEDSKAVFYYGADMSTCPYTKEQAKAAAEAERDRLNDEWRKEHTND